MEIIYQEALCFIAQTKVVIPVQLAAHLFDNNSIKAVDLLEEMRLQLKWLGKISNFKIPDRYGSGMVDVYYLTEEGAEAMKLFDEDIHRGIGSVGKPTGRRRAIIVHDLYINKSLLWFSQYIEIENYESEKVLRKELFLERLRHGTLKNNSDAPLTMGDFRVEYRRKTEEREYGKATCEIALSLNYDQIETKPDGMWWFVNNEAMADLVSEAKGDKARYICNLGSLNSLTYPDVERKKQTKLFKENFDIERLSKNSWRKMLYGLKKLGGAGTAEAVAAVVSCNRTTASRVLSEMESEGFLFTQSIHLTPGIKVGARKKLFIVGDNKFLDLHTRRQFLIVSEWVTKLNQKSYFLKEYDSSKNCLYLQNKISTRSKELLVVIDDEDKSLYQAEKEFLEIKNLNQHRLVKLSVWMESRKRKFQRIDEDDIIFIGI